MLSFKPKSNKKIKFNKKSVVTIDTKHKEFLNEFSKDENKISDYKSEMLNLKNQLRVEDETLTIEQKLDIQDKILELKQNQQGGKKRTRRVRKSNKKTRKTNKKRNNKKNRSSRK
jgi:hypothetical protein